MVVKQTEMSKETILELKITRKKKIFSHHFMTISQFLLKSKIILIKVNFYIFLKNKMWIIKRDSVKGNKKIVLSKYQILLVNIERG